MIGTKIEWATDTVNFWWGCVKVSPACQHCYAESLDARFHPQTNAMKEAWGFKAEHWGPTAPRLLKVEPALWDVARIRRRAIKTGERPRVFVNSMSDFFEDRRDLDEARKIALLAMRHAPEVDFLLLTKRPEKIMELLVRALDGEMEKSCPISGFGEWLGNWIFAKGHAPRNIWLGTTCENQEWADRRIPELLKMPAAVRFLSVEPMLGPVDLSGEYLADRCDGRYPFPSLPTEHRTKRIDRLDWVICGGESGAHARPMHPDWARSLRDQCAAASVPFFFKQQGEWLAINQGPSDWFDPLYRSRKIARYGEDQAALDEAWGKDCTVPQLCLRLDGDHLPVMAEGAWEASSHPVQAFRVGKKVAGRLLDGAEHNGFPESQ